MPFGFADYREEVEGRQKAGRPSRDRRRNRAARAARRRNRK